MFELNNLYLMDCLEGMKHFLDDYFELAIVDPPYRDENQFTKDMRINSKGQKLGQKPDNNYFDELFRISKNQIIWGANNFSLPNYKGFVAWKKKTISEDFTMSMVEIAFISEGLGTVSKFIEMQPQGSKKDPRIHPTQKPVALYRWLLQNYAKKGDKILDTHVGSGSSIIACLEEDFEYIGFEINEDYCKAARKRIDEFKDQGRLFESAL